MPGPAPLLCPLFPEAFLQQARREVRRKTAPYQTVQRYQLVLLLHENARLSHAEAGERVELSGRQVQRWRQRWAAGDFSVEDRSGRGRPSIFFPTGSGADQGHRL